MRIDYYLPPSKLSGAAANAAWAREICPTRPGKTTNDKAMIAMIMLVMTPNR